MIRSIFISTTLFFFFFFSFGQDYFEENPTANLESHFQNSEMTSNQFLDSLYPNKSRDQRIEIKDLVIQGSRFTNDLNRSSRIIMSSKVCDYLNSLKSKILVKYPVADRMIRVYVVDESTLNAFATINSSIYVNSGLLARLETEGQLVYVLCHEIMHIINQHIIGEVDLVKTKAETVDKGSILNRKKFLQLYRHDVSRKNELQADVDGFGLFEMLDYDLQDAHDALKMLKTSGRPVFDEKIDPHFFFTDSIKLGYFFSCLDSLNVRMKVKEKPVFDSLMSTHPSIEARLEVIDSLTLLSVEGENSTLAKNVEFLETKLAAQKRTPILLAKERDFVKLFLYSSNQYHSGNDSKSTLNDLLYSLQRMYLNKIDFSISSFLNPRTKADSLLTAFVIQSPDSTFFGWVNQTFKTVERSSPGEQVENYYTLFKQNIAIEKGDSLAKFLFDDDFEVADESLKSEEINFEDIDFIVTPNVDIPKSILKVYNQSNSGVAYENGKIAFLQSTNVKMRPESIWRTNYILDEVASDNLEKKSNQSLQSISKLNEQIISLIPNNTSYTGADYKAYKVLLDWQHENIELNRYGYISHYQPLIDSIYTNSNIRYLATSLNVQIKSFSDKQYGLTALSTIALPLYFPMLVSNTIIDGTRNFMLSVIIDVKTSKVVYWDRRTSNEPLTSAYYYQVYDEVTKDFMNKKDQ